MKKIYILTLIAGAAFATLLGSCKKSFLELQPHSEYTVGEDDIPTTPSTLKEALNGVYSGLILSINLYGRTIPVFGDVLADNAYVSTLNSGRYISEWNYSITVNDADVEGIWKDSYNDILRANNVINSPLNSDEVRSYKGEAYALRALNYFNLVRFFGKPYSDNPSALGVPIVLKYDPTLLPKRATVSAVYTQILADLDSAYSMAGDYRGSGYFSKYAARALAAKVNLYMGDYETAYTEAEEVINDGGFSLVTADALPGYFKAQEPTENMVETLFEAASDATNNVSTDELVAIYSQDNGAYGDLLCTQDLYDLYSPTDVRKSLLEEGDRGGPAIFVNKYSLEKGLYGPKKIIRLSEVYLIAAEAGARTGKGDAQDLLNDLMAQRDPSLQYHSTGAQLVTDIITERRKELAFEGDRFHDLNRLKLDIERGDEYPTGTISYGDPARILPIPQAETNVNPGINNP